jgi:hypothetical protein
MLHHTLPTSSRARAVVAAAAIAIAFAGSARAQAPARALRSTRPAPSGASRPATTTLPVTLEEEDVITFIGEPTSSLIAARTALARGDARAAGSEVAAAAAFLRVHAGSAAGADRADLLESARDLDRLAVAVRQGNVRSVGQFDDAVRHTDRVLARHHWERANRAWAHRETVKTGQELRAAADATDRAAHRAGRDVEAGTRDVVRGARLLSGKLIDGAGWTVDEVGKGLADLGGAIERLGRHVEPRR